MFRTGWIRVFSPIRIQIRILKVRIQICPLINLWDQNYGFGGAWPNRRVLDMKYNIFFYFYSSFRTFFHGSGSGFFRMGSGYWPMRTQEKKSAPDPEKTGSETLLLKNFHNWNSKISIKLRTKCFIFLKKSFHLCSFSSDFPIRAVFISPFFRGLLDRSRRSSRVRIRYIAKKGKRIEWKKQNNYFCKALSSLSPRRTTTLYEGPVTSVADPHLLLCGSGFGIQKMSIWIRIRILGGKD